MARWKRGRNWRRNFILGKLSLTWQHNYLYNMTVRNTVYLQNMALFFPRCHSFKTAQKITIIPPKALASNLVMTPPAHSRNVIILLSSMAIPICFWGNFDIFISNFCRYKACIFFNLLLDAEFHFLKLLFKDFLPKIIREAGNYESLILCVKYQVKRFWKS